MFEGITIYLLFLDLAAKENHDCAVNERLSQNINPRAGGDVFSCDFNVRIFLKPLINRLLQFNERFGITV